MKCIRTQAELKELAKELGVRRDWHEPDEQEVSAKVVGRRLDNAFAPTEMTLDRNEPLYNELTVVVYRDRTPYALINLATLLAWATGWSDNDDKKVREQFLRQYPITALD